MQGLEAGSGHYTSALIRRLSGIQAGYCAFLQGGAQEGGRNCHFSIGYFPETDRSSKAYGFR